MILSAVSLFRRNGYNGTGFRDVVAHANAPRGSIYHHFPNGKAQLGVEAVQFAGAFADATFKQYLDAGDVVAGLEKFWAGWTQLVERSDFEEGCPIVGVAVETHPESPELSAAAAEVFRSWQTTFAAAFGRHGSLAPDEADDLAAMVIAALEGATIIARAGRSTEPLVRAGRQVARTVRAALSSRD
jgi:AcrR family transcriptional regulator